MGKTCKCKKKCAAKSAKCSSKAARKCAKLLAFALAFASLLCGCASTGDAPTAQRSQSQHVSMDRCVVVIAGKVDVCTNGTVSAEGAGNGSPEILTQTQSNEGAEKQTPTYTATPTNETKPDLDLNYNGPAQSTGVAVGALERLLGSGASWLAGKISGSGAKTITVTDAQGNTSTATCENGNCSPTGGCTRGNCSYAGDCADCKCSDK